MVAQTVDIPWYRAVKMAILALSEVEHRGPLHHGPLVSHGFHSCDDYPVVSPDSGAETPGGDGDCYKGWPNNCAARSRHAMGVKPVPTLLATMRHFSFS